MKTALKIGGLILGLVIFLSITVNGRPIFNHIYSFISPVTTTSQEVTEDLFSRSFKATKTYTKKLFDNSVPRLKDTVNSKMSGIQRSGQAPQEHIEEKEKRQLDQLIRAHH